MIRHLKMFDYILEVILRLNRVLSRNKVIFIFWVA